MQNIIDILVSVIEKGNCSNEQLRAIELLIKARSIEILRRQAESGVGFAMEGISRIASSDTSSPSTLKGKCYDDED